MKNLLRMIMVALFSTFVVAQPTQSSPHHCDDIENLLGTLAKSMPKGCPPCPALNNIFSADDPDTETKRECFDGKDNDEDGKTDCEDPDCLKDKRIQQRCRMREKRIPIDAVKHI